MPQCYTASVVVQSNTVSGLVDFNIYYTNIVGTPPAALIQSTYNSTNVTVDTSIPTISHVSVSSNNITGFAREGDTINFTVFASEELLYLYPILGGITGDTLSLAGQ